MKLTFKEMIETKSGKSDRGTHVFMALKNRTIGVKRRFTKPIHTVQHDRFGNKTKAAATVWKIVPLAFKEDLKRYTRLYNLQIQSQNHEKANVGVYSIFVKAVCGYEEPISNLASLASLFGFTVSDWIDNGLLPNVVTDTPFTAELTS